MGTCPQCNKFIGELKERRKIDGLIFFTTLWGKKLEYLLNSEKNNIQYKSSDLSKKKFKKTCGWVYGVNKEIVKDKKICIKQYSVDFFGQRELIKRFDKENG